MPSYDEKYGPPIGGAGMMGRWVRRRRDGAVGEVRQQRLHSLMVWVPSQRRNLTFRDGTWDLVEAPEEGP